MSPTTAETASAATKIPGVNFSGTNPTTEFNLLTIGAGKTAVSKQLIALWSAPLAYIEGDQFWPFLVKRADGDRREDFRVIMRAMTSAAGSFSRTAYDVLLDFSIPPPFARLSPAITSGSARNAASSVVIRDAS